MVKQGSVSQQVSISIPFQFAAGKLQGLIFRCLTKIQKCDIELGFKAPLSQFGCAVLMSSNMDESCSWLPRNHSRPQSPPFLLVTWSAKQRALVVPKNSNSFIG